MHETAKSLVPTFKPLVPTTYITNHQTKPAQLGSLHDVGTEYILPIANTLQVYSRPSTPTKGTFNETPRRMYIDLGIWVVILMSSK